LLHHDSDFFSSYAGKSALFSSYVGFFYGGKDAKDSKSLVLTVFLFYGYVGIHNGSTYDVENGGNMTDFLTEFVKATDPDAEQLVREFLDSNPDRRAAIDWLTNLLRGEPLAFHWAHKVCSVLSKLGAEMEPVFETVVSDHTFPVESRAHAANALWFMKASNGTRVLMQALNDPEADVRSSAAFGLGNLQSREALLPLMQSVQDEYADVRTAALFALAEIADPVSVPVILPCLGDTEWQVRVEAAGALSRIGGDALLPLLNMIESNDPEERLLATHGLWGTQDARAISKLITALGNEHIQSEAIEALVHSGAPAVQPLLECITNTQRAPRIRVNSVKALCKMYKDFPSIADTVLAMRDDAEEEVRASLAEGLLYLSRADHAFEALVQLLHDPSASVRIAATHNARNWNNQQLSPELVRLLKDDDPQVRSAAAWALELCGTADAVPALAVRLSDTDRNVRFHTAVALRRIGASPAILSSLHGALGDTDAYVRSVAAQIVGALRTAESTLYLIRLLDDDEANVQKSAYQALRAIGTPEALAAIDAWKKKQ
jgi:HEAT repeat protein